MTWTNPRRIAAAAVAAIVVAGAIGAWAPSVAADANAPKDTAKRVITIDLDSAWLGVMLEDREDGVFVERVVEKSPAATAGIEADDRIVAFDGTRVEGSIELVELVSKRKPGDTVTIEVDGKSGSRRVEATLAKREGLSSYRLAFGDGEMDIDIEDLESSIAEAWEGVAGLEGLDVLKGEGTEEVSRGYLGVGMLQPSSALRQALGGPAEAGILVDDVVADSPAAKAGLRAGDLIVAIDGEPVDRAGDLRRTIRSKQNGASVAIEIVRERRTQTITATLGETKARVLILEDGEGATGKLGRSIRIAPRTAIDEETQEQIREAMERAREAMETMGKHRGDHIRFAPEIPLPPLPPLPPIPGEVVLDV